MKIVPKLTLSLLTGTCLIVAGNGYLRVRREMTTFVDDRVREHAMIGRALAASATAVWKAEGEMPALASIDAVSEHFRRINIHWIAAHGATRIDAAVLAVAPAGQPVTRTVRDASGAATWYTYVPIDVDGERRGALELAEPAVAEKRFIETTLSDALRTAIALALLSALLSFALGHFLVGRPVGDLAARARRIGRGDFSRAPARRQRDELSDLSAEMNAMCDRLVGTLEQLRHADRLAVVGKLASGVAHELGTPLNVVLLRGRMIQNGETTLAESRDCARSICASAGRMARIIRQLLQFSRRSGVRKAATNVEALAEETLDLLRPLAARRSIDLQLEPRGDEMAAPVDAGQLQQVISNLVMNAIQASPQGGPIKLRWYEKRARPPDDLRACEAAYLCLDVEDSGEGIRPEDLPRVFEPFFTTKEVGEGTGLGLAVSDGIVRDHGGWITVESAVGEGTKFTVLLPLSVPS